jgi:hypothetical protein
MGIFVINFLIVLSCQMQNTNPQDSILDKLKLKIGNEWDFKFENDSLVIKSNDSLWIAFYNIAGAPLNDPEYKKYTDEYLQEHGRKTSACIIFRAEKKWTSEKINEVRNENIKIYEQIDSLISKYQLSHLKHSYRWNEELFWEASPAEEIRIKAYKKEKEALKEKVLELPYYNSQYYSLFVISENWMDELGYMVPMIYPAEEKTKINELEKSLNELLSATN